MMTKKGFVKSKPLSGELGDRCHIGCHVNATYNGTSGRKPCGSKVDFQ
jgi:hypothetical protein